MNRSGMIIDTAELCSLALVRVTLLFIRGQWSARKQKLLQHLCLKVHCGLG